ncbi:hypothetical protein FALBO_11570 [Fusarium albosuccineum]|uniref:Uncharacterized protein n=1 Tax=Fusarium albosuccineum TaxID=1237068 RepID=A0A8H4PHR7_9HYPO|nr:hypothetical protein FALBO_11570 [Fusarium albosuccineum]
MFMNDIEWAPSAFWQCLCQHFFRLEDGYAAIAEQPPDDGRDAVDIVPYGYNPSSPMSLAKIALFEIKRASYPRDKLVTQSLKYALKAVAKYQPHFILALSIHNSDIMPWILWNGQTEFEPFFPHWPQFIPIHANEGVLFFQFVDAIKDPANLQHYREIPDHIWTQIVQTHQVAQPAPQAEGTEEQSDDNEGGNEGGQQAEQMIHGTKVHIRKETHRFRSDVSYFHDLEGNRINTTGSDWEKVGRKCYQYRSDSRYWCSKRPS